MSIDSDLGSTTELWNVDHDSQQHLLSEPVMTISIAWCGELHVNCKGAFSKEAEQELSILKLLSLYDSYYECYCHFTL